MSNIRVRAAVANDQAFIAQLVVANQLNAIDIRWQNFIVAEDETGQQLGCGQIRQHGNIDELASLVIIEKAQGQGISNLLMDALLERGRRPLWLMCESPLTKYYTRFGFEEATDPGRLPAYFQSIYWFSRIPAGPVFFMRGTYLAFMQLNKPAS